MFDDAEELIIPASMAMGKTTKQAGKYSTETEIQIDVCFVRVCEDLRDIHRNQEIKHTTNKTIYEKKNVKQIARLLKFNLKFDLNEQLK